MNNSHFKWSDEAPEYSKLMESFLEYQDIADRSKQTYRGSLKVFFNWFIKHPDEKPSRDTILEYKKSLHLRGLRPTTSSTYLVAVRKFFEFCEQTEVYPNVAKGIKAPRRMMKNHLKDPLTVEQIKYVLSLIDVSSLKGKRDYAVINLLVRTGMRLHELMKSNYEDIDLTGEDGILWVQGKGQQSKDQCVILTEESLKPMLEYTKARVITSSDEALFTSVSDRNPNGRLTIYSLSRMIKNYFRSAKINSRRITAHSLRHTFGVLSIKSGSSLHEVQLAMRHNDPSTTQVYLGDIEQQMRREGGPEKRITSLLS